MAKQIELVHPLYLDVPMVTSFLAALEDGVAYGMDVTRKREKQRTAGAEGEGKVGIPTIPILSSLLNFDLRGKISESNTAGNTEEVKLIRKHTEASLFMGLRYALQESDLITTVNSLEDLGRLQSSDLVEVTGQIFRSPLSEALEAVMRTLGLFGIEAPDESTDTSNRQSKRSSQSSPQRRNNQQVQQQSSLLQNISQFTTNPEYIFVLKLLERMKEDLTRSKIVDVVMSPSIDDDFEVVIALASEYLPESAFQTLLSGEFTVLGKVVRVLKEDESINLYQRTTFSYLSNQLIDPIFDGFRQQNFLNIPENSSFVEAPAIQVLPLAIFT